MPQIKTDSLRGGGGIPQTTNNDRCNALHVKKYRFTFKCGVMTFQQGTTRRYYHETLQSLKNYLAQI